MKPVAFIIIIVGLLAALNGCAVYTPAYYHHSPGYSGYYNYPAYGGTYGYQPYTYIAPAPSIYFGGRFGHFGHRHGWH